MNRLAMRFRIAVSACLIVALVAGTPCCAARKPPKVPFFALPATAAAPLTPVDPTRLGIIGVVPANLLSSYEPLKGPIGKGATAGNTAGKAGLGWVVGMEEAALYEAEGPLSYVTVMLLTIAALPVVLIGGAIAGAVKGPSRQDIQSVQALMVEAFEKGRAREETIERLVGAGTERMGSKFVSLSSSPLAGPECAPAYAALCISGVDSILEIDVLPSIRIGKQSSPTSQWFLTARARLIRASDKEEILSGTFQFHTEIRRIKEWADGDARLLRRRLKHAYQALADEMLEEMFLAERDSPRLQ